MHARTPCVGTLGGLQTAPDVVVGPRREWRKPKPMTNGLKKSDEAVRPVRAAPILCWIRPLKTKVELQHQGRLIMSRLFKAMLLVAILATQICHSSEAAEVNCKDASPQLRKLQEALYHYAVLAEIPYEDRRESSATSPYGKRCKVKRTKQTLYPADQSKIKKTKKFHDTLRQLLRSQGDSGSDDRLNGEIKEYEQGLNTARKTRWNRQYVAIGDRNGVTYIGCRRDELTPRVFVTWKEMSIDGVPVIEFVEERLRISSRQVTVVVPQIYIAVLQDGNHPNTITNWTKWEELGVVKLAPVDPKSKVDEVFAIRGTDWENLSTVITSVKDVVAESCAFEITAVIVKAIGSRVAAQEENRGRRTEVIVTGHSLGGTATQYIGQSNLGPSSYAMRGYAFNAMGVDQSQELNNCSEPAKLLYSHYVHGDPVSFGGGAIGRIQPGKVLVSKPASNLPDWLSDMAVDPVHRHKLDTVQKALCQCLNEQGRVVEK